MERKGREEVSNRSPEPGVYIYIGPIYIRIGQRSTNLRFN